MSVNETVEALARSVTTLDSARRVGWAKSYNAEEREQEALRDLNVARGDLAIMAKFTAFCFGLLQGAAPGAEQLATENTAAVMSMLPRPPIDAGQQEGQRWQREHIGAANAKAIRIKASTEAYRSGRKAKAAARKQERDSLIKRYGFPDEAALVNWLEQYRARGSA